MNYLDVLGPAVLALLLGASFALSLSHQIQLQRIAMGNRDDNRASLFQRVTFAGLSFAIMAGAILIAKYIGGVTYVTFMLVFCVSGIGTLLAVFIRKRKA